MRKTSVTLVLLSALAVAIIGCGGISKEVRSQVTYTGAFSELQADPEQEVGETVIFGGKIIGNQVTDQGTQLMVLQLPLGGADRPRNNDLSKGRFLIRSKQFIDPAIYPDGTLITVVGRLAGSEVRTIGQMPYRYPVIEPLEIKKWPPETEASPRFHFGIGVGTVF